VSGRHSPRLMPRTRRLVLAAGLSLLTGWAAASTEMAGDAPLPGLGGSFRLTDERGQPFRLDDQPPRSTLVFFGFTRCTQTCSPALALMQAVAAQVRPKVPPRLLFISLDPLNDTPATLKAHVERFGPGITGLTGTPEQIDQVARQYGVTTTSRSGELDHSARIYLLSPDLRLVRVYRLQTSQAALARDVSALQAVRFSFLQP